MKEIDRFRLDKNHLSITSLSEQGNDTEYWLSRTPEERFEALEFMRQIM
jgi:hypothetical protein